jgi:DNA topoisomerase-3
MSHRYTGILTMAIQESGTVAVLAEKPSVARDIASVLGATSTRDGYLHGNGYVVTWAIGHLVALAQPHEINPAWRQWRRELLPMLPKHWPLVVYEKTKDQFEVVRKIINSPRISRVVCATDAGREGELIFRYIYEAAQCEKPFSRLWISSLTPDAIRKGLAALRPGSDYDPLADAARGRSRADWLVGMNLSRAYSVAYGEDLSVGRVQTPTLAMLVDRELAVRSFVPEDYLEVVASFHPTDGHKESRYEGTWFRTQPEYGGDKETLQKAMRLSADGEEAGRIVGLARTGTAAIESIESEIQRTAPPPLYDLTELQRHANRLFGFSAQQTLDVAQVLYERHKLISYPRTDSRHVPQDVAVTLPRIVKAIAAPYQAHLTPGTGERPLGRRFVDDAKVTDHHAIIPTTTPPEKASLSPEERKIYELVCRRLLSAWHDDHVWSVTTIITAIRNSAVIDRYHTSGTAVQQVGWKVLDIATARKPGGGKAAGEEQRPEQVLPSGLKKGDPQEVVNVGATRKKTRPPKRLTEASLLTAMETAGKTLDEKELSDAMKETGLGTPATRAAIIEVLLKRGYIIRNGKSLEATDKGIRLIAIVHAEVKSPAMTGQWEAYLTRIQRGKAQLEPFLRGIEDYVREVVGKVGYLQPRTATSIVTSAGQAQTDNVLPASPPALETGDTLATLLHRAFGFSSFRPNQEAVCQAAVDGKDVLLVMPTGSGKSLCYQLPGIARGGTTLVISPLIALMEDQVAKLKELGFAVERIHSGRERAASRQACLDYLNGKLQFLFIAPERLRVAGFPEMLAKLKPSLIAIDEAHCISEWGHDFRPDYRMLGLYLPTLRPAPVIALTATATPLVQDDIAQQLGLVQSARFIHGFRRANIAIEAVEAAPSRRTTLACQLLRGEERRPGIVYTPTRKQAESVAAEFATHFSTAAYHAGLDPERRKRVQEKFLAGKLDVMVATIAFGMGIDKPDVRTVIHTALPGSLEAYYQEIGRAGRDGKPSRAVLMHSYADRYTHDFFFERDYPAVTMLDAMFALLRPEPMEKGVLQKQMRMDPDLFDKALEKLWIHGGAVLDYAENVSAGQRQWRELYIAHGEQKRAQIEKMIRFADTNQCRMSTLVRHFGDFADGQANCGICDFCDPAGCVAQRFRTATEAERAALFRVLAVLRSGERKSTGKLHAELFPRDEISRDAFEDVLGAMARAGLTQLSDAVFEKDGKQIPYRTVRLTPAGRSADKSTPIEFIMKDTVAPPTKRKRKMRTPAAPKRRRETAVKETTGPKVKHTPVATESSVEEALRTWRLFEARRRGMPAFRIFSDQTLRAIAKRRPTKAADLLAVAGIGLSAVEKYGRQIYRICQTSGEGQL